MYNLNLFAGGGDPTPPPGPSRYSKPTPAPVIDLPSTDDEDSEDSQDRIDEAFIEYPPGTVPSDSELLCSPSEEEDEEDRAILRTGPVISSSRMNAMYPRGCPARFSNINLPFHPSHQFVDREMCTLEQLEISNQDMRASQLEIDVLARRLIDLNIQEERVGAQLKNMLGKKITNARKGVQKVGITNTKKGKAPKQCKTNYDEIRYQSDVTRIELHRVRQQRRNQDAVNRAIRIGINFRSENEHTNFVLFINEDFPVIQATRDPQPEAFPPPYEVATRKPRDRRHDENTNSLWDNDETIVFEIKNDLTNKNFTVVHVNSIDDFFKANRDGKSKIVAFPFVSDSPQFMTLKNEIGYLYMMFFHTISGWFPHSKHTPKINQMHLLYIKFHEKLQAESQNVTSKMNAITNIRFYLMSSMSTDLHWYYHADKVLNKMIEQFNLEILKM